MSTTLQVLAGTSYDEASLREVHVNDEDKIMELETDLMTAKIAVRIQDYQGKVGF